jgi:enoyl-[acyl-carrier-protein] reductase (NADH)
MPASFQGAGPLLLVAGTRDEMSLGWSAATAWLRKDAANRVLLTVRSIKAKTFAEAQRERHPGRIEVVTIDWADPASESQVSEHLARSLGGDRGLAGVVHAVAGADLSNFTSPAHVLSPTVYTNTFDVTAASLVRVVAASTAYLVPFGGIVTFGFGEFRVVSEEYGGALSTAKLALSQMVAVLGISLGQADPPARTLEIVTGFIPTYSGRGVAVGIAKANDRRVVAADLSRNFCDQAPLKETTAEGQRLAAGALAVSFISDPMFRHTTGERIHVDGGWATKAKSVLP